MVHLQGWTREYGTTRVETDLVRGWSNVRLVRQGEDPVDVSQCGDVHCGQPSLSFAGDQVVFVKASRGRP
jgi:hypothetical protein